MDNFDPGISSSLATTFAELYCSLMLFPSNLSSLLPSSAIRPTLYSESSPGPLLPISLSPSQVSLSINLLLVYCHLGVCLSGDLNGQRKTGLFS